MKYRIKYSYLLEVEGTPPKFVEGITEIRAFDLKEAVTIININLKTPKQFKLENVSTFE